MIHTQWHSKNEYGFSYIELLVVITIAALLMTGIRLTTLPDRRPEQEAQRLLLIQDLLADQALFTGKPAMVELFPSSYRVFQKDGDDWTLLERKPFKQHELPPPLMFSVTDICSQQPEQREQVVLRIIVRPDGLRTNYRLTLCSGQSSLVIKGLANHGQLQTAG